MSVAFCSELILQIALKFAPPNVLQTLQNLLASPVRFFAPPTYVCTLIHYKSSAPIRSLASNPRPSSLLARVAGMNLADLADLVLPVVPVFRFSLEAPEAPGGQVGLRLRDFAYSVALWVTSCLPTDFHRLYIHRSTFSDLAIYRLGHLKSLVASE